MAPQIPKVRSGAAAQDQHEQAAWRFPKHLDFTPRCA
jgi:hypothetical protein